jgi:hypothetical protein
MKNLLWIVFLLLAAACGSPTLGAHITPATPSPAPFESTPSTQPSASTGASSPVSLGRTAANIRTVDWANTPLPGAFCGISGLVGFHDGQAMAQSAIYGNVHLNVETDGVTYGDLIGDGKQEAVVDVSCDNNGGTAEGDLAFGAVVVGNQGQLRALGTITTKMQLTDVHVTLIGEIRIAPGKILVTELWYRETDAGCCPSGKAVTTWSFNSGSLTSQPPVVTG